ncbi:MAG TPA: hypothetical protein VG435_06880 [Acidimicrobiales bacterium]|jgi:hypothetical protein|nr:hypothetical protein [Acidimicrobiales bacterium]
MESGRPDANPSLEEVRRDLDALAERRLNGPWTERELQRWHELIAIEEELLGPDEHRRP